MGQQAKHRREAVRDQAAAWVVRLSDRCCTAADRRAFEQWRAQSVDHEIAYERETLTWETLDRLGALNLPREYPGSDKFSIRPQSFGPARLSRPQWAAAAGIMLAVGFGTTVTVSTLSSPAYATGVGEHRTVVLDDGSRIELNTNSRVIVRYRRGVREVELERGEALFEVMKDNRPFVVSAAGTEIRAGQSELAVRLGVQGAVVRVREGNADIFATTGSSGIGTHAVRVSAGFEAIASSATPRLRPVAEAEIDRSLAWRRGGLAFDGQTLAEAASEFNRYNRQQIVIADGSIRNLRVGGYFHNNDMPGFVKAVTTAFSVKATKNGDGVFYLTSRSEHAATN